MTTRRRARGEGAIYERADGRWTGVADLGWRDGKRVRRSVYGRTRTEVRERLDALRRSIADGVAPAPDRLTVGAYLDGWLVSTKATVRPSTWTSYDRNVRLYLNPALGKVRLTQLTAPPVARMLADLSERGLSPRTAQMARAILRRALGQAVRQGLVHRNIATLVDAPRQVRFDIAPLSPEEVRTFLASVKGNRLEGLYVLALASGMRSGELRGLRWADVDLETGILSVSHSLQRIDGHLQLDEVKSSSSRRGIKLPAIAIAALRDHRRRQLEERLRTGEAWQDTGLVFTTALGSGLDGPNLTHDFQRALAVAGISRRRFHDLRHSAATLLLVQGVSPRVVQDVLGHSSVSLTLNTYSHVMPALRSDAAERMHEILTAEG